jgi:polo-like kinase 1
LGANPPKQPSQTNHKDKSANQAKIEFTNASTIPIAELAYSSEEPCDIIQQFVDFSSKYGLGYKLSNGAYGVHFNDSTKIALDPSLFHFDYIHRNAQGEDEVQAYTIKNYPESLNKKVILLQHFKSYLDGNAKFRPLDVLNPEETPRRVLKEQVFVKKWKRAKKAVLFRMSSKIIHVLFQDMSELVLFSGNGLVTFVTSKKQVKKQPLSSDLEAKDPSMYKRLQYAKDILIQMISKKPQKDLFSKTQDQGVASIGVIKDLQQQLTGRSKAGASIDAKRSLKTTLECDSGGLATTRNMRPSNLVKPANVN